MGPEPGRGCLINLSVALGFVGLAMMGSQLLRAKTVVLLALVALCIWRKKLRISYELWQLTHDVLGVAIIATALAHVFLVGYYVDEPWERVLWLAMSDAFVVLLVWVRIVRPLQLCRSSWRVEGVVPEQSRRCPRGYAFQ